MSGAPASMVIVTLDDLLAGIRGLLRERSTDQADAPEFLTLEQVAALLQKTKSSVRKYVRTLGLPAIRLGPREWRFRRSDVLKWLDEHKEKVGA
jgi:excisionase family DNA binding protein